MGTSSTALADNVFPARENQIAVFAVTPVTLVIDLFAAANLPALVTGTEARRYWHGCYVSMQADGDDIYFTLSDTPGAVLDPTVSGGMVARTCARLVAGTQIDQLFPGVSKLDADPATNDNYRYLNVVCRVGDASELRMWVSSTRLQ